MKEAIVQTDLEVRIVDSPIPAPDADQVVIKVTFSGSNPKDWKGPVLRNDEMNSGDDIAGTVYSVGSNVYEFQPGDRVAAFHEMRTTGGSFAEYAVAWQHTTFHLPKHTTFEEAATLPLAAMTAAVGLYLRLGLPEPWSTAKPTQKRPILVYGAASAVGAFAIQFAKLSNLHPIIGVAGRGIPFAESLIDKSKGDAIVDYRNGDDAVVSGIKEALKAAGCEDIPLQYCFDGISENGSQENTAAVLASSGSKTTYVLPLSSAKTKDFKFPEHISHALTMVGSVHGEDKDFAYVWYRYLARLLEDQRLKPHPYKEIPGGLVGVSEGLKNLKAGKASGVKYIFDIGKTEGVGDDVVAGAEGASAALQGATTAGFRV